MSGSELWWPICHSEDVSTTKPMGIQLGSERYALYRDDKNVVRVLEDRCPHRRAPLSLGRITPDGNIQCGYHGWTFNGESGELCGFPNLAAGERMPHCSVDTFVAAERRGLVYLWTGKTAANLAAISEQPYSVRGREFHGSVIHPMSHEEVIAGLLDAPGLFIDYLGAYFTDKPQGDPRLESGLLVMERAARWNLVGEKALHMGPLRHRADFPLLFRTHTALVTGETTAQMFDARTEQLMAEVLIAAHPCARNMTALHWRVVLNPEAHGKLAPLYKLWFARGKSPVSMLSQVDTQTLAQVLPGPAEDWRRLSQELSHDLSRNIHTDNRIATLVAVN